MLRLLHTSDWHLGQVLRDRDRSYEHERFLTWLTTTIVERDIDVLLHAGDVFDVANPPATAQRLFYEFIARAQAAQPHLQMVVVAGNHDSPSRLEAPNSLLTALGATVVGRVPWAQRDEAGAAAPSLDAMIVPLRDRAGNVAAHCLTVPFLRPGDVPRIDCAGDAYALGIEALYRQLMDRVLTRRGSDQAVVAMGHATVLGSSRGIGIGSEESRAEATPGLLEHDADEAESADQVDAADQEEYFNEAIRPIMLGGLSRLQDRIFGDELAYVALGHLHRASRVGKSEHIRYSGSPIPLSFAERSYRHQVVYVELEGQRARRIEPILVPRSVRMLRIPHHTVPLAQVAAALAAWEPSAEDLLHPVWLEVAIDAADRRVFDLVAQIDDALRGKPVCAWRLSETRRTSGELTRTAPLTATSLDEVKRSLDPEWLLAEAWRRAHADAPLRADLVECLRELLATEPDA